MSDRNSGVQIGHWTSDVGNTGCTVLLFEALTPAVVDVRGGAPGTRETDLLRPGSLVGSVDAILLTGGSAFGLAAADGVMTFLKEKNRGVLTRAGAVPIVSGAVIFDLDSADSATPDAGSGYAACMSAGPLPGAFAGRIGAGAGATYQKLWGPEHTRRGGIAISSVATGSGTVTALVVLNAVGTSAFPSDASGNQQLTREAVLAHLAPPSSREATTIGAVIVDLPTDGDLLTRCAIAAHDGLARSIVPAHTVHDGDLFFAAGLRRGEVEESARLTIPIAAELAVERAIAAIVALPDGT